MINDYTEISLNLKDLEYLLTLISESKKGCPTRLSEKLSHHAIKQVMHMKAELAIIEKVLQKENFMPNKLEYKYTKGKYLYYTFETHDLNLRVNKETFEVEKIVNKYVKEW